MATLEEVDIGSLLGGVPFVDRSFKCQRALSMLVTRRKLTSGNPETDLARFLDPDFASSLVPNTLRLKSDRPDHADLSPSQADALSNAIGEVIENRPGWAPLFEIPLKYRLLTDGRISMTSALVPQTVFLGETAFATFDTLVEIVVHEASHIWLNFLAEIADLQTPNAQDLYVLPSGTPGKTVRSVLLAAHFAVATHALHNARGGHPQRVTYLENYIRGCLALIAHGREVSPMGHFVAGRLSDYARRIPDKHS